jgi:multiple sugar transport system substrate-binding protein
VIDEPLVRDRLIKAIDAYTTVYRKSCTPPDAVDWADDAGNNKAFLAERVVMTPNATMSIPGALRATRPEDYYKNVVTLDWPIGAYGQPLAIYTRHMGAVVFRQGGHLALAQEFVHFLAGEGWLGHWLDFTGDRFLPPIPALIEQPFWLDPSDPHRIAAAMQFLTQPQDHEYRALSGNWRHSQVDAEHVWGKEIHHVVTDGISPEQAVDEAIARIKQILSE